MGLSTQTLKNQNWTELSWRNNAYTVKVNVRTRLENLFCNGIYVFPLIITDCTLLSLLQRIKLIKLHVVRKRKLTLFSWGKIDYTTRISATVQMKHVFSMNFTHFHEIFLQQWLFHCNRLTASKYANTEKQDWTVFIAKQYL